MPNYNMCKVPKNKIYRRNPDPDTAEFKNSLIRNKSPCGVQNYFH